MSKQITVQGKIIEFPTSAQSPNWAGPVLEFAEAVESALSGIVGTYDVSPQIYTLSTDVNTNVDLPLLSFPTANVRGAFIRYSMQRKSNTTTEIESGVLQAVYNSTAGTWTWTREGTGNSTKLTFNITNAGQVQFSTTAIGGVYDSGKITYQAQALLHTS